VAREIIHKKNEWIQLRSFFLIYILATFNPVLQYPVVTNLWFIG
jgi:hypothetical protein